MTGEWRKITAPLGDGDVEAIRSGDLFLLSGTLYTARDKAHERISGIVRSGGEMPFDARGQIIYYTGPSPAPPGRPIGSAGPTTSYRMDPFTGVMLGLGVKGMIGKGGRDEKTRRLLAEFRAVYFSTFAGAGAYLGKRIREASVVAFEDLGPEAVYRLAVEDFPLIAINDIYGGDLYESALRKRG
ncbi:MAG: FumA C-terminus/TtdB family hydratase beta subunit [Spirochaetes bacterium]|jgi:fumarate hydratase subunit beta|nr:FumA C-terminus/TtdB family hydratase beta subunit [Spirochaetota bacterium]